MPALIIGHELNFVNCDKGKALFQRHSFDGADVILRISRQDFFFARNQRHLGRVFYLADFVIDFARQ